jgi:hypothetical protein
MFQTQINVLKYASGKICPSLIDLGPGSRGTGGGTVFPSIFFFIFFMG